MSGDLVERLDAEASRNGGAGAYAWRARELCGQAAAEILALRERLARVEDELSDAYQTGYYNGGEDQADGSWHKDCAAEGFQNWRSNRAALQPSAEEG